ncbi:hypothetical protein JOF41_001807 [Saccharothrix coeruleofusca]|uniref:DUF7224 domain-containing protein n=1 Tax=Saccharothrix coeruleofusca TaxID=33919 RepID=UPI001AE95BF0|nr:hypothetical protein [Saccharothrix coeruleofusca]MBP2335629.1 hypothetical protein [Saccharothrix coeruleofusca]
MNPLLIALRRGSAPVGVPVMTALGLYAGTRGGGWSLDWGWTSGQLQQHGVLLVPLTAALAAWDASRDRRTTSAVLTRTYPRSPLPWLLLNCVGALLAGLAGWTALFTVMALDVQGRGSPYWSVVLLGPLCLLAAVLVGAAAGRHLPRYLAAPIVAVVVWVGLAYGSGSDNPLLARLSAVDRQCCEVSAQPVQATVAGQWLWIAALAVAAIAVLALPEVAHSAPLAVIAVVLGVVAVSILRDTGGRLTEARQPTAESCGTRDGVTVCMWPEHAAGVNAWLRAISRYRAVFADLGAQPDLYLEHGLRPGAEAERIGPMRPDVAEVDVVMSLAQRLVPAPPACAVRGDGSVHYPAAHANALLTAWLTHRIRPDLPTAALVPPAQAPQFARLLDSGVEQQRAWYAALVRAHGDCTTPAPAVP